MVLLALAIAAGLLLVPLGLVVLPIAILFWVAFTVLRLTLRLAVGVIVLPIVVVALAVGAIVAGIGLALAVLLPLVPFALVAFFVWTILRLIGPKPSADSGLRA